MTFDEMFSELHTVAETLKNQAESAEALAEQMGDHATAPRLGALAFVLGDLVECLEDNEVPDWVDDVTADLL